MKKYRISEAADQYVNYDMIHLHTELPSYSEPRLKLLFAALNQSEQTRERSELYTLVTSLVQLGMDTHDLVDTEVGPRTEKQMRSRQLKILAGDYFSARFYQLLAAVGEEQLIGKISKAVADVNRLKVSFYEKVMSASMTAEEYLSNRIHIKSKLFEPFQQLLIAPLSQRWKELLHHITRFEVVVEELKDYEHAGGYARSYMYWSLLDIATLEEQQSVLNNMQASYAPLVEKYNLKNYLLDALHLAFLSIQHLLEHEQLKQFKQELLDLLTEMKEQLIRYDLKSIEAR